MGSAINMRLKLILPNGVSLEFEGARGDLSQLVEALPKIARFLERPGGSPASPGPPGKVKTYVDDLKELEEKRARGEGGGGQKES